MKKILGVFLFVFALLAVTACGEAKKEYTIEYSENLTVEVGQTINPKDYFTLKLNDEIINNDGANVAVKSGSINQVGTITYVITYEQQNFEMTLTVVEKEKPDNPDIKPVENPLLEALKNALVKDYGNSTFTIDRSFSGDITDSTGQTVKSELTIHEVNYIYNNTYHVVYEDSETSAFEFYVDKQEDYVYLYRQSADTWTNTPLTYAQWEAVDYNNEYVYSDYFSGYTAPSAFSLQISEFEIVNNQIQCISSRVDLVGQKIFSLDDDAAKFTSITIELENDYIKTIAGEYVSSDDYGEFTGTIQYSYSHIGTTVVELPSVSPDFAEAPEHIDPARAEALTNAQKNILSQAFATVYTNYEFSYYHNEDNGYLVVFEHDFINQHSYKITQEVSRYGGYEENIYNYYFDIENYDTDRKYYIYESNALKQYSKVELTTQDEILSYMPLAFSPSALSLNAAYFGVVGDTYVCTFAGLSSIDASQFTSYANASVISLNVLLNSQGTIEKIEVILKIDGTSGTYYIEESYAYTNINETEVNIPLENTSVLEAMTQEQTTALQSAFQKDFSNVTVYDEYVGSTFYFAGERIKTMVYADYLVTDYYKIENGKYYEYVNGTYSEIPFHSDDKSQVSFDYYLPVPNFSAIDISQVYYNVLDNSYCISIDKVNIAEFLFYFDMAEELKLTFTNIEFILDENGYIKKINIEAYDEDNIYTFGTGLLFTDYGTTVAE